MAARTQRSALSVRLQLRNAMRPVGVPRRTSCPEYHRWRKSSLCNVTEDTGAFKIKRIEVANASEAATASSEGKGALQHWLGRSKHKPKTLFYQVGLVRPHPLLFAWGSVKFLLNIRPAVDVVVLQRGLFASKGSQMLRKARLEHKGHGVAKFVRTQIGI